MEEKEILEKVEMTSDEFIKKTKEMLQNILADYTSRWKRKYDEDDESEENCCSRCGGCLYIEQGGDIVDCYVCNGTGINTDTIFDAEGFCEFIEHEVIFGNEPFLELIEAQIIK